MSEDIMPRTKDVEDGTILSLFDDSDAPFMTAGELADAVGMSRQGMHNRLLELHDAGEIERKKTGRTIGWWRL